MFLSDRGRRLTVVCLHELTLTFDLYHNALRARDRELAKNDGTFDPVKNEQKCIEVVQKLFNTGQSTQTGMMWPGFMVGSVTARVNIAYFCPNMFTCSKR